jgi:ribonuclease HI
LFVILDFEAKRELNHEWGLEIVTNNQAEAYALLQEITSINSFSVMSLIAIGDSSIIINLMNNLKTPSNSKLAHLIARLKKEVIRFGDIKFFHVPRDLNRQADNHANSA